MSFIPLILNLINYGNEIMKIIENLNEEKERAKQELKKKGIEIEPELAILKIDNKWKAAIVIDLPDNIEYNIAQILKYFDVDINELNCEKKAY